MTKKKPSQIFEGEDSSLHKAYEEAIRPTSDAESLANDKTIHCTCASFFTVKGVHKKDCPCYISIKTEWEAEALLNIKTNSIKVIQYENETARILYPLIIKHNGNYEIIKVVITRKEA